MAAKWAVCTIVWNLGFPVFAEDFELGLARATGTLPVKVALTILGERNGDALATFKVAHFANYIFKHRNSLSGLADCPFHSTNIMGGRLRQQDRQIRRAS